MKPTFVRRHLNFSIDIVMDWLIELHQDTLQKNDETSDWLERLALRPLNQLELALPSGHCEEDWILKVRKFIEPLYSLTSPLVFEHGDLSSPNILISQDSKLGVVDWELAEPVGLPAVDLFFFLTYIAFAREKARTSRAYLAAFQKAFFGRSAWARPYVIRYCEKLELKPEALKPLFMLCWLRYVANLVIRLENFEDTNDRLSDQTTEWLLLNRYYILLQFTIQHINELYLK
jgi:thiamine kinase-like enzyme